MNPLSGLMRSLLFLLAGCVIGAVSFAAGAVSSSRSKSKLFSESSTLHHQKDGEGNVRDDWRKTKVQPTAIATWMFGKIAVDAAKGLLEDGASALDALEAGLVAGSLYYVQFSIEVSNYCPRFSDNIRVSST